MRSIRSWIVVLVLLFFLTFLLGSAVPLDFVVHLILGWLFYLSRVVSQVTVSFSGIATGVVSLALFWVGAHWLFKSVYATRQSPGDSSFEYRVWSPRWTASIVFSVVLMFAAGTAMVGITHQVVWLVTSDVPLVQGGIREGARRSQSSANLKQMNLAIMSYAENHGNFPAGGTFDGQGRALHSWQTALLPYVEYSHLYDRINFDLPWDSEENAEIFDEVIPGFRNPGAYSNNRVSGYGVSDYAANPLVLRAGLTLRPDEIRDAPDRTIIMGEVAEKFRPWGYPANWRDPRLGINRSPDGFGGPWKKRPGAIFAFADGSTRLLSADIDPDVLEALCTPSGGENVEAQFADLE